MSAAEFAIPAAEIARRAGGVDAARPATGGPRTGDVPASPAEESDGCRDLELEAEEQCRLAGAAREHLDAVTAELGAAWEHRDRQVEAARALGLAADGRRFGDAREAARAAFQAARDRAASAQDIADAASTWLAEIDRINAESAAAEGQLERMRASLEIATATAEHLAAAVEAARSAMEAGDVACVYARRRARECAEARRIGAGAPAVMLAAASADVVAALPEAELDLAPAGEVAGVGEESDARTPTVPSKGSRLVVLPSRTNGDGALRPAIERVLAGEHAVLDEIVARLADDEAGRRRWADRLTVLLEAILIRAVDSAAVDVPADHPFWGTFTAEQSREIISALASLGHHFDGLGGWLDDRAPDQRDLSLAVAHAGLDPMRLRRWPTNAESAELLRDAVILGADYLAAVAPALSVEELTEVLGREGQALGDLWAEWDRIRAALVTTGTGTDGSPGTPS